MYIIIILINYSCVVFADVRITAMLQPLVDTVYDSINRFIFLKDDTSDPVLRPYSSTFKCYIVFFNCIYNCSRQYFAIVIILSYQNHVIRLLQWNDIAKYVNYCPTLLGCKGWRSYSA